ncbi:tRNA-dihydrouridine synthase family protein [Candidatus Micrarchaeota archaeon]|nr:tRNA-dihydrouridine synthase family protein [Candidatus Micrarchaeota archaeon]
MVYSNFLSPIDNYSNLPFRLLCQKYGAVATCVPLVNSTAIANKEEKTKIVDAHPDEKNIGVQLVGQDPKDMGLAAKRIVDAFPFISWLNLNCGCPSARTMNSGGGSALLHHPDKIVNSIKEMKNFAKIFQQRKFDRIYDTIKKSIEKISDNEIPISVKIRIKNNFTDTLAICKQLEQAGVSFIIIHGRTAGAGYSGSADWELIKAIKSESNVPIVGNGDITTASEGEKLVKEGFCDSFMVARSAMSNPKMFSNLKPKTIEEKMELLLEYLELHRNYAGEPELKDVKLKAINFVSGSPSAASIRNSIARVKTVEEIMEIKLR